MAVFVISPHLRQRSLLHSGRRCCSAKEQGLQPTHSGSNMRPFFVKKTQFLSPENLQKCKFGVRISKLKYMNANFPSF